MPNRLQIDPGRCTGCRSCELACALENDRLMATDRSRIAVVSLVEECGAAGRLPYNLPVTCRQCADAPCLSACPEGAVARDQTADDCVIIFSDRCTGCGKCRRACPFGAIKLDRDNPAARKCELCGGHPACVVSCPSGAIRFEPAPDYYAQAPAFEMEAFQFLKKKRSKRGLTPMA